MDCMCMETLVNHKSGGRNHYKKSHRIWIDGRAAEGASLENWRTEMFRGFESYSIRQLKGKQYE